MHKNVNCKRFLNTILQDDDKLYGGVSFDGETLKDFLEEIEKPLDSPMCKVNIWLEECGIKPIEF